MTVHLTDIWAALGGLAALVAFIGGIFAALRYIIRAETSELRNNGGSSIKDAVGRIDLAARVAAEKAEEAAALASETKSSLDAHVEQSRVLIEQGRAAEQEIRGTIATLADAVKIAAQSTPPDHESA